MFKLLYNIVSCICDCCFDAVVDEVEPNQSTKSPTSDERAEVRPQADLEANKVPPQEEPEALEDLPLDEVEVDQGEMQHIDPPVDQHNDDSTSRSNNSNNSYDPLYDDIPKIVNQWRRDVRGGDRNPQDF